MDDLEEGAFTIDEFKYIMKCGTSILALLIVAGAAVWITALQTGALSCPA